MSTSSSPPNPNPKPALEGAPQRPKPHARPPPLIATLYQAALAGTKPPPATDTYKYQYSLDANTLRAESRRLLSEQPPTTQDRFICYLLNGTDALSNIGRYCERESFEEKFRLDDALMHKMYGAHEEASIFFLAMDQQAAAPAGVIRIIRHSRAGLLTLNDCHEMLGVTQQQFQAHHSVRGLDDVWDIGSVVVRKRYRSADRNLASNLLFRAMHARAGHEGIAHYVGTVDRDIRRMIQLVGFWGGTICDTGPVSHSGSDDSLFSYGHWETINANVKKRVGEVTAEVRPVVEMFARRCIDGEDMDHRLMFDISKAPTTALKKQVILASQVSPLMKIWLTR
ncbi:hypothetical protein PG993_010487 [Apiospora rasikravindrae]|uniref:Uncharacterized protein n=1 Tax=Apiospora rasikravindrae TaxID=990691 RepID=A0ABR1SMC5_9PEZI